MKSNTDIQITTHKQRKTNMAIDKTNLQAIHNVLITDLQRRIFKQYNARKNEFKLTDEDYDNTQTLLVDSVLHTNNMRDINELLTEYCDLCLIMMN
jgi:hypothetical protein